MLRSEQYDDIYFSAEDGLAETQHVFLAGNDLPERFAGRARFTIAETGFGTGLNFLAAWDVFEKSAGPKAQLDFISFEKNPLAVEQIREALSPWQDILSGKLEKLLERYPLRLPGFHRLDFGRVRLTLVFDDVNDALPQLCVPDGIDAWFLDGFAPAKNPDMWTETLFENMARLSAPGASFSTFTAAGAVKRGLAEVGFTVEKTPGFGRKREMLAGRFPGERAESSGSVKRVAIIGGGLAGTACAYVLKQRGMAPVIFEAGETLAAAASGNVRGMINPRFCALRDEAADFYTSAYALAHRTFSDLPDETAYDDCGCLYLLNAPEREKRFSSMLEHWGWPEEHMRIVSSSEASERAGLPVEQEALYLPNSGAISPAALCRAYADGVEIRTGNIVEALEDVKADGFDVVILACGAAVTGFSLSSWLPVSTVRGQVTQIRGDEKSSALKCCISYGGYICPAREGVHVIGATFQKWLTDTDVLEEDDERNLGELETALPSIGKGKTVAGARAALRTASHDHMPMIGPVPDMESWKAGEDQDVPGLYVSTGHSSHGLVSTIAGAHLLADQIEGSPRCLPRASVEAVSPARFLKRARRREEL